MINKVTKLISKILGYLKYSRYVKYYMNLSIDDNIVLFDSKNGNDFASNMFYLLKEFIETKDGFKYYIVYSNKNVRKRIIKLLANYNITNIKYVKFRSLKHLKVLAKAKYIFSDNTMPRVYIKKEGQIYTNTWHGTPLKCMGRDTSGDSDQIANVQRNLLLSDILVYPSEYMKDKMLNAYLVEELHESKILYSGYPRNSIFLNRKEEDKIRKEMDLEDKRVYVYMPTYRGAMKNTGSHTKDELTIIREHLNELDKKLKDNEILYVKLHVYISKNIDLTNYKHIRAIPSNYETYHFLNVADVLITDYSSVFFDFALSKKKIVLFTYDMKDYLQNRGIYLNMNDLPFPKVETVDELYKELNTGKKYDDSKFLSTYNTYDCENAAEKVINEALHFKKETRKKPKKNILVYCGKFSKNGITTAFYNLFKNIDKNKFNVYVTFNEDLYLKNMEDINKLKEYGLYELPFVNGTSRPLFVLPYTLAYKIFNMYNSKIKEKIDKSMDIRNIKNYGYIHYDAVIHYTGYGEVITKQFPRMNSFSMFFIHNDIVSEIKTKHTRNPITTKVALNTFDKVVLVSDGVYKPALEIAGNDKNFMVAYNICNYEEILEKSKEDIVFSKSTFCNVSKDKLENILNSKDLKFINIGRFSHEKCHNRIISTFERYNKENPKSYLIIIGGYGDDFEDTLDFAKKSSVYDRIVIIKSINNPMPILKKCNGFILFSKYEAFPMTLMEADVLSVPIIMSNCEGPYKFWKEKGAKIIPLDDDELLNAMKELGKGKIKPINIDFKDYNRKWTKVIEDSILEGIKKKK